MTDNIRKVFSKNLKSFLKEQGRTQLELANYVGVSDASVNNWVNGIKLPRMDKVDKICKFLGVSRSELIEENPIRDFNIKEEFPSAVYVDELDLLPIKYIRNFKACCGSGIMNFFDEDAETTVYMPTEIVGNDTSKSWIMGTTGDSMNKIIPEDANIVVRQQEYYQNGDIVLYQIYGDFSIKEYYQYEDRLVLKPFSYNPRHEAETHYYKDQETGADFPIILGKIVSYYGTV